MLSPNFDAIPMRLRQLPRWLVWASGKRPFCSTAINSLASVSDPETWSSFDATQTAYEEGGYLGIGFVLNGDGIVGVDLDNCVESGVPSPDALGVMDQIGCEYVELSPSGAGLRGFGYGAKSKGRRGNLNGVSVELYSSGRYLTVTGQPIRNGDLVELGGFSEVATALVQNRNHDFIPQKTTEEQQRSPEGHLLLSSVGCEATTPKYAGQRNRCLFELARRAKAAWPDAERAQRRDLVRQWYAAHHETIGTKAFAVSMDDFERAWEAVRYRPGDVLKGLLTGNDLLAPLPHALRELGYGPSEAMLWRICVALQAHAGNGPFFIGARKAAELLGHSDHSTAAAILRVFVGDGVLVLVSKGAGKVASRYRISARYLEGAR